MFKKYNHFKNLIFKKPDILPMMFSGGGLNDVSFAPGHSKGSFSTTLPDPHLGASLETSWSFYNYVGGGETGITFPNTVRNPNKAIVTCNAKTSEVRPGRREKGSREGVGEGRREGRKESGVSTLGSKDEREMDGDWDKCREKGMFLKIMFSRCLD